MKTDRFLVAPFNENSGQQNQVKPWLIPDQAFEEITNAYVFRGRVRKRFGAKYLGEGPLSSRLRVALPGTTNGAGNYNNFVPLSGGNPIVTPAIGQQFSIGDEIFTVVSTVAPYNLLRSGNSTAGTFNTNTGQLIIGSAAPNTTVYYYPALPVMGLISYAATGINNEQTIAFDTTFAYEYNAVNGGWQRISAGSSIWSGSNSQFIWATTYSGTSANQNILFVSNFNPNDQMRTYDGTTWSNFRPALTSTENLITARIILPFKNRLIALNTYEGTAGPGTNYSNRCRFSQVGSPLDASAFRQDIPGRGNGIDAPTKEAIITAEFIKDRLIVYFEQSTWELVYTGNQAYPFSWQQISSELGAESTFSIIPFDQNAIGVGNVGIHSCNGTNVSRIDNRIPDAVFAIHNENDGPQRVYGIRDYYLEILYWSFPSSDASSDFPYPNRILIYDYKTGTWSFFEDSVTCFGYFQPANGTTWDATNVTWSDETSWAGGTTQALFRKVVGGNQQGYTFICDSDKTFNESFISITNLTVANNVLTITSINHNFRVGEFIYIERATGTNNITLINNKIYKIESIIDNDSFTVSYTDSDVISGNYSGGATIARVSNVIIKTKQYNFYAAQGRNAFVSRVDFLVDSTPFGQTDVDFFVSTATTPLLQDARDTATLLGTGTLDTFPYTTAPSPIPFEQTASRLWRPVYFQADGEVVQLEIKMNDEQMRDTNIRECDFELHAMLIFATPSSMRLQ